MKIVPVIVLIASLPLGACSMQAGDFPSLAKRPYEEKAGVVQPTPIAPVVVSALPEALRAPVNGAISKSDAAHTEFLKMLAGVQDRVNAAKGAAVSSESWVVAQMDLAGLEMIRSPSVSALADIDRLYMERLNAEFDAEGLGGADIIAEKRQQIEAQVHFQQTEIDRMKAALR